MPVPKKKQVLAPDVKSQIQKLIQEELVSMDFPSRADFVGLEQWITRLNEQCQTNFRDGLARRPSDTWSGRPSATPPRHPSVDGAAQEVPTLRTLRTAMIDENTMGRFLQESVWEIPVMIGFNRDHPKNLGTFSDSLLLCVALLLNIIVQFLFCIVIARFLLRSTHPELEDIRTWRETLAHSFSNMHPSSSLSLVNRVCSHDDALIVATSQKTLREEIVDYTQKFGPLHAGILVFCLCSLIWGLEAVRELRISQSFGSFLYAIPVETRTVVTLVGESEFEVTAISRKRKFIGLFLAATRVVIAVSLWIMGAAWLAHTASLENMILNCAALSVVLGTDESLYAALAPMQVKSAVQHVAPLKLRVPSSSALIVIPIVELFALVGYIAAFLWAIVLPNFNTWTDIDTELCEGATDFVWSNTSLGVIVVVNTPSDDEQSASYQRSVVSNMIWGRTPQLAFVSTDNPQRINQWASLNDGDTAEQFVQIISPSSCDDISLSTWTDDISNFSWLAYHLRKQTGSANAISCSDVQPFCGNISFYLLRTGCPFTCGCGSIQGLFLLGPSFGCPSSSSCLPQTTQEINALNCSHDVPNSALQSMPSWHSFWQQYVEYATAIAAPNLSTRVSLVDQVRHNGCSELANITSAYDYFCSDSSSYNTFQTNIFDLPQSPATRGHVAGFCPYSCDCSSNNFCPSQIYFKCRIWGTSKR